ncbi:PCMD domain-containing protein [Sediminitomix flava]|uniref:Putative glycosyl hydrolase or carbohydrate binding protein n=1 Tax=Sediminitomix flava TaxID=379075 RepID=A0A315Z6X3_SEDFL|nr:PCMD domain-containing protein [Sediminitomix flava]PWJ40157.1 putative glycosyl hydrolase or carbohydrate binding protein [Sediminitomix flava]
MNRTYSKFLILTLFLGVISSCIEDRVPYPVVLGEFLVFNVEGQTEPTIIDTENRIVTVEVADEIDLSQIKVLEYQITEGAEMTPEIEEIEDFTTERLYTITTYQDYDWTVQVVYGQASITAIAIEHQYGDAIFDERNQTVNLLVGDEADLTNIRLTQFEISDGATADPDPMEISDFSEPVKTTLTSKFGDESEWTINVSYEPAIKSVEVEGAISDSIYVDHQLVEITMPEGTDLSSLNVTEVILQEGASSNPEISTITDFSEPQKVIITTASGNTQEWTIRVQEAIQVEFSMMNDWYDTEVKNFIGGHAGYYHLPGHDENSVWGSGDIGAAMNKIAANTITPKTEGSDTYAHLESKSVMGVLAAGSLFTGTMEANGIIPKTNFGMPFTTRPSSFEVDFKSEMKSKDNYQDGFDIYIILQVREGTGENEKRYRLGTAWYRSFESFSDWQHLDIPIHYGELPNLPDYAHMQPKVGDEFSPEEGYWADPTATPTHAIVVFSSSYDGDNMNGVIGSNIEINNVKLKY